MRRLSAVATGLVVISGTPVQADQPFGWIGNGHSSAYTLARGEFELSGNLLRVDDTIDFLNLRNDLLAVGSEVRRSRFFERNRLAGNHVHQRAALKAGEDRAVELLLPRFIAQDQTTTRAAQRFMRRRRNDVRLTYGTGMDARGN